MAFNLTTLATIITDYPLFLWYKLISIIIIININYCTIPGVVHWMLPFP